MSLEEQLISYFDEEYGRKVISSKEGFIMYSIKGGECFISDLYSDPEYRNTFASKKLFSKVKEIAHQSGCHSITATVYTDEKRAEHSTRLVRCYAMLGFNIVNTMNGSMILKIDLQGGK